MDTHPCATRLDVCQSVEQDTEQTGAPLGSPILISFNNMSNTLSYLYEKTPHINRKCGIEQDTEHICCMVLNILY